MAKKINIYTDGACSGNQNEKNIGGWGCVLEYNEVQKELCGGEFDTTNNRMELTAVIKALSALKEDGLDISIFSDSSYVVNCFKNKWYINWQKNDWKNSKKQTVENKELWEELLSLISKHKCVFYLVKGHVKSATKAHYDQFVKHNGSSFSFEEFEKLISLNNRCDELANVFINENKQ